MKSYSFIKSKGIHKHRDINRIDDVRNVIAEHQYDDSDDGWRDKSMKLQVRRWRKIKNQTI